MSAFSPDQIRLLQAAFDHVWTRVSSLHDDLNEDSARIAGLGLVLRQHGLLTLEAWDNAVGELTVEAAVRIARSRGLTEQEITSRILAGDAEAFERREDEES